MIQECVIRPDLMSTFHVGAHVTGIQFAMPVEDLIPYPALRGNLPLIKVVKKILFLTTVLNSHKMVTQNHVHGD